MIKSINIHKHNHSPPLNCDLHLWRVANALHKADVETEYNTDLKEGGVHVDPVTADVNTHRDLEQDHRRWVEDAEGGLK